MAVDADRREAVCLAAVASPKHVERLGEELRRLDDVEPDLLVERLEIGGGLVGGLVRRLAGPDAAAVGVAVRIQVEELRVRGRLAFVVEVVDPVDRQVAIAPQAVGVLGLPAAVPRGVGDDVDLVAGGGQRPRGRVVVGRDATARERLELVAEDADLHAEALLPTGLWIISRSTGSAPSSQCSTRRTISAVSWNWRRIQRRSCW